LLIWGGGVSGAVDNLKNDARPARPEKTGQTGEAQTKKSPRSH